MYKLKKNSFKIIVHVTYGPLLFIVEIKYELSFEDI